jgi:hypothetical protein
MGSVKVFFSYLYCLFKFPFELGKKGPLQHLMLLFDLTGQLQISVVLNPLPILFLGWALVYFFMS